MRAYRGIAVAVIALGVWLAVGSGISRAAGTPASLSAVEGQALTDVVVDSFPTCGIQRDGITIDWGDGTTTSAGTLVPHGGNCDVTGSHTYTKAGSYTTTVSYKLSTTTGTGSDSGSATVADVPVSASAVNDFNVQVGSALSGVVAHWSDPVPQALSNYTATIDWGDGTSSAGAISSGTVNGNHKYVNGGRFTITVTFHDAGGASANAQEHAFVTGCPTSGPTTPAPGFTPSATDLNARWVQAIYHDILGRSAAPSEVAAATGALSVGATRSQIALTLLDSTEYRGHVVSADYTQYLHRGPAPSETSFFVGLLGSSADESVSAQILGSAEYFTSRGNSSNDGFLSAMYCDALTRSIDVSAQNTFENALGSGTPRTTIAAGVLGSTEYRALLVRGLYLRYLRRAATSADLAPWIALMKSGGTDEQVIAAIVSSPEYFDRFNNAAVLPVAVTLHGDTIATTLTRNATLTLTVFRILPGGHTAAVRAARPRTKLIGTVNFGIHHKGHVKLHWNRRVNNHRLGAGRYVLVLKAFAIHKPYHKPYKSAKPIGISDPIQLRIR